MTGNDALETLLARLAASHNGAAFFAPTELREWPKAAVSALKKSGLLTPAEPANSVTCNGCERQCHMPVESVKLAGRSAAFIACDKPFNVGRVWVRLERLERWQANGEAVAVFLAATLGIRRSPSVATAGTGWDVGMLRGKHAANIVLRIAKMLILDLAGHKVPLIEVLSLKGGRLELQRQTLIDYVDHPVAGGGTQESVAKRRARLVARRDQLIANGVRNFLKVLMAEEGVSSSRIKQLLTPSARPAAKG